MALWDRFVFINWVGACGEKTIDAFESGRELASTRTATQHVGTMEGTMEGILQNVPPLFPVILAVHSYSTVPIAADKQAWPIGHRMSHHVAY